MDKEQRITQSRLGRLTQLGKLAGGIFGNMASEGVRQLAQGQRPTVSDLLITPDNVRHLAERLSEMRGAAMKVGQLLSMESGELMPPTLSQLLANLRDNAHSMPLSDVARILNSAWGSKWDSNFRKFSFTPLSAASIGQVHKAELRNGSRLAIKIQYPGIRRSIDSDVNNMGTLLRLLRLVPKEIDLTPLLEEARKQLHREADYRQEADSLQRFSHRLSHDSRFEIPTVVKPLTTPEVLAMSYLDGEPIETLADVQTPLRNELATALLELALLEVFEWGLVQTDPNFANYRYDSKSHRLQLLDFGATREYSASRRASLRALLLACVDGDDADIVRSAIAVGYIDENDPNVFRAGIIALLRTVTEPVRKLNRYAFGHTDLVRRMSDTALNLRLRDKFSRVPPCDVLFLHRKLGGLYLLLSHLRATIPTRQLIAPFLVPFDPERDARDSTIAR